MKVLTNCDWGALKAELREIRYDLSFELFGDEEFEHFRLNRLTYGLVEAPTWAKIGHGIAHYPRNTKNVPVRDLWIALALQLGKPLPKSLSPPPHILIIG